MTIRGPCLNPRWAGNRAVGWRLSGALELPAGFGFAQTGTATCAYQEHDLGVPNGPWLAHVYARSDVKRGATANVEHIDIHPLSTVMCRAPRVGRQLRRAPYKIDLQRCPNLGHPRRLRVNCPDPVFAYCGLQSSGTQL